MNGIDRLRTLAGAWDAYGLGGALMDVAHEDDELWCEHCDIELDDSWRFCPSCGAKVVDE